MDYVIVDVFTREKFKGNPLAVVFEDTAPTPISQAEKQAIAKEFNLSETVFVGADQRTDSGDATPRALPLTIMTPFEELPFAGHPVVGAACALSMRSNEDIPVDFITKAGRIETSIERSKSAGSRALAHAQISVPFNVHLHETRATLSQVYPSQLGVADSQHGNLAVFSITKGMTYVLVPVKSMDALSQVRPLRHKPSIKLDDDWSPSFVGTYFYHMAPQSHEDSPVELHTRMIEHELGEDPVTGSAACALAAYLTIEASTKDKAKRRFEYQITQGEHMGRVGLPSVSVTVNGTQGVSCISSMTLSGDAVRIMQGTIDR
ncbi:MAG: hypothetical protein Q9162_006780 [Coniocarpon cinnabarinum]